MLKTVRLKCKCCGKHFSSKRRDAKTCSNHCRHEKNRPPRIRASYKKRRCKYCGHWFQPKNIDKHYCNIKCERNAKYAETKELCIAYKGGKCKKCGYKKCRAALDF